MATFISVETLNIILLIVLLIIAVQAVVTRNLLVSVIFSSIFSLVMSILYLILGAPDVAMTEAAVGAGISTILFLATMLLTGYEEKKYSAVAGFIAASVTGALLLYSVFDMPKFGDISAPANQSLASHYIQKTSDKIGIENIVTAVLASYRGFDTLGEVTVIFTAGIGVLLLLGNKKEKDY